MSTPTPRGEATLPRGLVLGSCIWVVASWILLIGPRPPLQPTSTSYAPAIRMMVQSMLVLTTIGWPLLRLSTWHGPRHWLSTVYDTAAICVLWQIVLWPLRLVTHWPVERLLMADLEAVSSALLVGGVLAAATGHARGRTAAMAILLCWTVVLPVAAALMGGSRWLDGPFLRTWIETGRGPGPIPPGTWHPAAATAVVALAAWGGAIAWRGSASGDSDAASIS